MADYQNPASMSMPTPLNPPMTPAQANPSTPAGRTPIQAPSSIRSHQASVIRKGDGDTQRAYMSHGTPYAPMSQLGHLEAPASVMEGPTLQNIVSTVNLGCKLDLKKIALKARNAEYNPKRFAAVIMRIREPRTTALIFSSGKMVCTGAKSEDESRLAARKYARIIQKLDFPVKFLEFKIQNMVGSVDVRFAIMLENLSTAHSQFVTYEPELFPGLIYRMVKPRIVLLIFVSGKVVLTGAKTKCDIDTAFSQIYPILRAYKKL